MIRLNLQLFAGEKTEKATGKKRDESRKKGQIVKSTELSSAITFLAAAGVLKAVSFFYATQLMTILEKGLTTDLSYSLTAGNIQPLFLSIVKDVAILSAPLMGTVLVIGVMANAFQTRGLFTLEAIKPDFGKLNPIAGFSRLFSLRSVVELVKSIAKLTIVAVVIYTSVGSQFAGLDQLMQMQPGETVSQIGSMIFDVLWKVGLCLLVLGLFDYFYQRYEYEKSLRMTKQEVKDEFKQAEGNPQIKSKIKEKQRALAIRRMMHDVPKADVVITNPTHYAVALQYDSNSMEAPKVLAKGIDEVAQRIKQLARDSGVVLVENRPLAQSLYKTVDIGAEIPTELFQAVAEVLAYVYRLKRRA